MRLASLIAAATLTVVALPAFATVLVSAPTSAAPARAALPNPQLGSLPDVIVDLAPPETSSLPTAPNPAAPASAVPDAATWALMLTGLLAVGAMLRRRKPVVLA